ncbi:MAG: AmmeMemoRadiSam system protein B [Spirochaetota bacterium]|jgi:hypothetical protein|nr:AmmeMemoRadiSam system protein B [Spirochaetota bacterium]
MIEKRRRRVLPFGWYPSDRAAAERVFQQWEENIQTGRDLNGFAAIVPHAGWSFSGELAYRTMRMLDPEEDVVVVIGGHMMPGSGVVAAFEETIETPLGPLEVAGGLLELLKKQLPIEYDRTPDNTVEVQLPMIKHLFGTASVVWLRVGAGEEAIELGRTIAGAAHEYGGKVCVVGSTDLTHYGPNYGFTPRGTGRQALEWARKENDAGIIQQMVEMNPRKVLEWGEQHKAACSAGAAAAAIECASAWGCEEGILIGYENSYSIHPDSSFVGYAGVIYSNRES